MNAWRQLPIAWQRGSTRRPTSEAFAHVIARVGSMMTLFLHDAPVTSWNVAQEIDTSRYATFFWRLIEGGVYFPCSQYEALFVSAAHTDEDVEATVAAVSLALDAL